jgi:hypothetical protein
MLCAVSVSRVECVILNYLRLRVAHLDLLLEVISVGKISGVLPKDILCFHQIGVKVVTCVSHFVLAFLDHYNVLILLSGCLFLSRIYFFPSCYHILWICLRQCLPCRLLNRLKSSFRDLKTAIMVQLWVSLSEEEW